VLSRPDSEEIAQPLAEMGSPKQTTPSTRLKDFIDLWSLTQIGLDSENLAAAIVRCFDRRGTALDPIFWESALGDQDLIRILDQARARNFQHLQMPTVAGLFQDILIYLRSQNFTRR
jgi:hypothetical protein